MNTSSIIEHIVQWLKDYAQKTKVNGYVVGVSGGIDSAVVSAILARTGLKILMLEMPIRQKQDQVDRAQEHMQNLEKLYPNVKGQKFDITPTFNAFEQQVEADRTAFPATDLALANSRSRLRMLSLYYFGQINQLLVAGTGNKVEDFGVGFFTKYGDGGVDVSPIADLMKSQIYQLAKALGVCQSILEAAPTDGLWDVERTDEQQLTATYAELEWAMQEQAQPSGQPFTPRQAVVWAHYLKLNQAMQHKINPIPVCKIPEAFL
jgi:NAD+ synthase